ncbi:Camk1 [Symbiodinium natans]|uniref:Camk1 protein n=1 Tax=Symbiodinium natans TaxID=878477 RepID=A0A812QLP0_9DINO|nr:Camk1 [Symbiodinium natans]
MNTPNLRMTIEKQDPPLPHAAPAESAMPWMWAMRPEEVGGWKTCPLRLGQAQLSKGKLQVAGQRKRGEVLLQACHSAVRYRVHPMEIDTPRCSSGLLRFTALSPGRGNGVAPVHMTLDYARFDKLDGADDTGPPEEAFDDAKAKILAAVRAQRMQADREAAAGSLEEAVRLYDDASKILLSLQDASTEEALQAVDLRVEALGIRLMAAKAFSLLSDWSEAEARASKALEAAMLCPGSHHQLAELTELGIIPSEAPSEEGFLVHRDAADALLCRARARLKLGDAVGARDDAAKARSLSGQLQDHLKQEAADGFLMQAQMIISASGHDPKTQSRSSRSDRSDRSDRSESRVCRASGGPLEELTCEDAAPLTFNVPLSKMPRPEEISGLEEMD